MFKSVKEISDSIISDWSNDNTKKSYPFMDDMSNLIDEFRVVAEKITKDKSTNTKKIIFYTLNNIHRMIVEVKNGVIVGQRISLNSLNRSIIENFIILGFILKYGEDSAKVYIANSEVAYQKFIKKVNNNLSNEDIRKIDEVITETKNAHKGIKFGNNYKWTNSFLGKTNKHNTGLNEIAKDLNLSNAYERLSLFHQQTHNSSGLAHFMNIQEHDIHLIYISKIINGVVYMSKILDIVCDESLMEKYNNIHNEVISKYDKLVINTKEGV